MRPSCVADYDRREILRALRAVDRTLTVTANTLTVADATGAPNLALQTSAHLATELSRCPLP